MSVKSSRYNYVNYQIKDSNFSRTPLMGRPYFLFSASRTLQKIHEIASKIVDLTPTCDGIPLLEYNPDAHLKSIKKEAQQIFDIYTLKKTNANFFQKLLLKLDTFVFNRLLGVATYEQHLTALNRKIQEINIDSI